MKVMRCFDELLEQNYEPALELKLGDYFLHKGDYQSALRSYRNVVSVAPGGELEMEVRNKLAALLDGRMELKTITRADLFKLLEVADYTNLKEINISDLGIINGNSFEEELLEQKEPGDWSFAAKAEEYDDMTQLAGVSYSAIFDSSSAENIDY